MTKTKWYAKPIYVLVALVLVLSLGIVAVPMAGKVEAQAGVTYYVNAIGGDDSRTAEEAKNPATPWLTIQHAVDTVPLESTIDVADGTYTIASTINVNEEVTITGDTGNPANVIVQYSPADITQTIFEIQASNVTIEGIKTISGRYAVGFTAGNPTGCTISHCILDQPGRRGINFWSGCGTGHTVEYTTISNVGPSADGDPGNETGIMIYYPSGALTLTIQHNTFTNMYRGIWLYAGNSIVIDNNTFTSIKDQGHSGDVYHGAPAIDLHNSAATGTANRVEVTNNTISDCYWQGILVVKCPHTYVYSNTIHNCNYYGIDGTGDWDYAAIHVQDYPNYGDTKSDHCIIDRNTVYDSINGIQIWSDDCQVTNNEVYDMGKTYPNEKVVDSRTYKNSGILVGSNFGNPATDHDPTGVVIQYNNIHDNYWGLFYSADLTNGVTAENNWWGHASGPYHPTTNSSGTGNAVSDNVNYMPWYATSTTTPDREWVEVTFSPDVRAYSDTIQGGVDAAHAGDTINVAAGTYTENVVIDKALILQGDGSYPTIHDDGDRPIYIKASSVTVKGFTIVDTTGKGGAVYLCSTPVSQVTIEDNRITQAWVGVWINPGTFDYITIKGNIMSGITHRGIMIMATVIHLNIEGNEIAGAIDAVDNSSGIYMQSVTGSVVTDNTIVGNNISGFTKSTGRCITGSNNDHVTISNNILTGSGQDILTLWGGSALYDILIEQNRIENAGRHGIALEGGANIQVLRNTVTGSTKIAIRIKSGSTDDIININYNNIENSGEYGLKNEKGASKVVDATCNWWGHTSGPSGGLADPVTEAFANGTGDTVSANVHFDPWLKEPYPLFAMASFTIDHAKIDFKKKPDDDKVRVKGKLELDLDCGDGVKIGEDVIVKVGPLTETIMMVEKGKKGEKWEYKRPKGGEGNIKNMTIDWKKGKFDVRMDKAELTGMTNPVTIRIQIGDDVGEETILMREKKHHWDYKAK